MLAVSPTGGGKTVVFSAIIKAMGVSTPTVAIAHRKELVSQIAMALAVNQVPHRVIGPPALTKQIVTTQMTQLGTSYYSPNAPCAVAGVDTLIRRGVELAAWMAQVRLWVIDEAHHLIQSNKWGKAVDMLPNAKGLGVTATPLRADGKGLGRHSDGVFDVMVEGPNMRELIDMDWLTEYRVFAPLTDINMDEVNVTPGGDFNNKKLKKAVRQSKIVGDVVEHYQRIAPGKQGITFATDVETAGDIATKFRAAGVMAEAISAETPDNIRNELVNRFRAGEITQLVNVDLFGEGFDLPAIEVCSMARPTESYGLYCQQFGRALRPMPGKTHAIIIDHVGNVTRHGLPDKPRAWSLDGREKRPRALDPDDDIPLTYCVECTQPYERFRTKCPYCGAVPVPGSRAAPEYVDGDLHELDPATLAEMRGEIAKIDNYQETANAMRRNHMGSDVVGGFLKNSRRRVEMQEALRESMRWWLAKQREAGRSDSEAYKLFYLKFGTDVMSAQTLGRPDALKLANKVNETWT